MKAIQITEFGGPEVLEHVELPDPEAADGMAVIDVNRAGINFADTHQTRNDYLAEQTLPMIPGGEVAGTVDGRRVAAMLAGGAYAQKVAAPEAWLVPVPDEVSDDQAAGLLLQGVTAHALVNKCAQLQEGETVVIEAAAGGTGALAVQIAKRAGARVIGLASSEEKRATAKRLGADATVDSRADDMREAILEANGGEQVNAVLQMSGGEAFQQQLRTLAPFGRMVAFGIASREEPEVRIGHLMRNSRAVIGFWLVHLIAQREELARTIGELMSWVAAGDLEVLIGGVYPLSDAAKAHEDIISRTTQGKLLLDPSA
ncbi:MAG: NADPH:quinone reductase [Solirubrobacterales bacterium]|jgi:NADPH2:quinone reductase|nr:NADPH:quinone reductase [Solirubrobacterales bacterium]